MTLSTDDSSFSSKVTLIDNNGIAIPNLNVQASLGVPNDKATISTFVKSLRSDASGNINFNFDISHLAQDGLINLTQILSMDPIPTSVSIPLYLNVTNANDQFLQQAGPLIQIPVTVIIAQISAQISPNILEVTQGSTQPYSFSVTILNQAQRPISNAGISYSITNVPNSNNTVYTNANGETIITLSESNLLGLSNLAIIAQGSTNTSIVLEINHTSYPLKILKTDITVVANSLKITANPVQATVQQPLIFTSTRLAPIDIEVSVADSFGKIVPAEVQLVWNNSKLNSAVDLTQLGVHIAPYTFSIDPNSLPVGEHTFIIEATMDGITTTHSIGSSQANSQTINHPAILLRKIIMQPSTIQSAFLSLFGILSGFVMVYAYSMVQEKLLIYSKRRRYCPHCEEVIVTGVHVCSHCGRDIPPEESNQTESEGVDEVKQIAQEQSLQEEQNSKE